MVNWARVLCDGECLCFIDYKAELDGGGSINQFSSRFADMSDRMWKKAKLDTNAATREYHNTVVSDVTQQNIHLGLIDIDQHTRVDAGIIQHTLATNSISSSHSSVPAVLKDLCKLLDEDVKDDFNRRQLPSGRPDSSQL